jgi:cell division protein FtsI/penicillin-binding protein 2
VAARAFARVAPARAKIAFYLVATLAIFLCWRLEDVQIRQGPRLASLALDQHAESVDLFAKRGSIVDRDGTVLVRSLPSESVYAVPTNITHPDEVAAKLAPILGIKAPLLAAALGEKSQFRFLARKIPHEVAKRVSALDIDGVSIMPEETGVRFTPEGHMLSTALGFVGIDENGLDGLEYSFDSFLRGTPGKMRIEADQFGRAIPFGDQTVIEKPHAGGTLQLTIDSYLQFETERALRAQVKATQARSGVAIVMDPWTGEVLALTSVPDFDPARYASAKPDALRDRAVADAYEPGSTFKLITATAAMESGRISPDARFPARDSIEVGGHVIHNAEDGLMAGSGGTESIEDIIAYSHNVGAAELGALVGPQQMSRTLRAFGFGEPTEIELPGENPGIVPPVDSWSGSSLATISFGHGISTTPIALARAYAAIANGGILMRPRIVRELDDATGKVLYHYPAEVERRVMSERTAAILQRYLRAVVTRGTGNPAAQVPGYTTAGKTGTAQVVENGRYEPGEYVGSFIGYVPAEHPRFVILVKIDRPRGAYYGGIVAAPVFRTLARVAMLHAGIMPDAPAPARVRTAPASKGRT